MYSSGLKYSGINGNNNENNNNNNNNRWDRSITGGIMVSDCTK